MRYEDTSGSFSGAAGTPDARDDTDTLAAGSRSPATGNVISGEGTNTASAGADIVGNAPGQIVAIQGAQGSDTEGPSLQAAGRYGSLTMNQDGSYSYRPNGPAPENARDVFSYTLADQSGGRDNALLTIDIGHTPSVAANAQQIVPGPDGVVTLPPGVELSDVHVVGRNLVIDMPDGTQMVIVDGAVFVPQLVLDGVEVPSSNLAALLIDAEPKPAAGPPQSGGGNFAVEVGPLDPGVPLGDLIPPTEQGYTPPEFEEVNQFVDQEPTIVIIPDGQPGAVNAVDSVDESGLPARGSEPEGTLESQNIETTTGVISFESGDGVDSVTINGVAIDSVGDTIETDRGVLTITSIDLDAGLIGYSYSVTDNTTDGVDDFDDFTIVITDNDGDTATGTLHIDIADDEPIARNDTDAITLDNPSTTGNVITAVGTTNSPAGVDTVGADDAQLTAVSGAGGSDSSFNSDGDLVVEGEFGTLTIDAEGNYTYVRDSEATGGGADVFTYTLTDGDGDKVTATLTITVPAIPAEPDDTPVVISADDTLVDEDGLEDANQDGDPLRPGETDSTEQNIDTGQIVVDYKGDVPANLLGAITLVDNSALDGQLQTTDGKDIVFALEGGQLVGRPEGGGDPLVIISITGAAAGSGGVVTYTYEVQLLGPVEHPVAGVEDSITLEGVGFQITDSDGDTALGSFDVTIVDDLPTAVEPPSDPQDPQGPPPPLVSGAVDEDDLPNGNDDVASGDDLPTDASTTVGGAAGSLAALFNAGADSPLQNFGLVDDTSGLPALTANGQDVVYDIDVEAGTLTAVADLDDSGTIDEGETIFVLTVNPDGSWSFQLLGQLDHHEAGTEDNLLLDFSSIVSAQDADGDPVTAAPGAFVIDVDDDMPQQFEDCPDDVIVVNGPEATDSGSLNLPNVGADQPGVVSFGVQSGSAAMDSGDPPQQLTSDGQPIFYVIDPNNPDVLEGRTGDEVNEGDLIFTITLNGDGTYTYQQFGSLTQVSELQITNLESVGGGNVDAKAIDVASSPFDLILSTSNGETINTSADWIGVGGGQSLDDGNVVRVDFLQNASVSGNGGNAVLNFGEYYSANSYRQDVGGLNSQQFASFTVSAIKVNEAAGSDPTDPADGDNIFYGDGNDTVVTDTQLNIYDASGTLITDLDAYNASNPAGDPDLVVTDNHDGTWTVTGLPDGFDFEIVSETPFQAVEVVAASGTDTFKLGVIDMDAVTQSSVDFSVPIVLTDADGDPVTCDIDVHVNPVVDTPDPTLIVNEAGLPMIGSDAASDSEVASGSLAGSVTGTGPFTFALVGDGDGTFGTLTLDEDGNYVYTLDTPVDGADANNGTNIEAGRDTFEYQITDGHGGVTTGTITIDIRDDVPTAVNDTDAIASGDDTATGNVITGVDTTNSGADTKGADDASVTAVTGFGGAVGAPNGDGDLVVVGEWGTLTIGADGEYTYVRDADAPDGETDTFTYTLTDGDGDVDTATLVITVANDTPTIDIPQAGGRTTTVDEAGLPARDGDLPGEPEGSGEAADPALDSDDSETTGGTITFTPGDTPGTVTIDGAAVVVGHTYAGTYGTLTVTGFDPSGSITYTYTLDDNTSGNDTEDSFAILVTDADGQTAGGNLVIDIIDDVPTARDDTDSIASGDDTATGNVITGVDTTSAPGGADTVGADDATVTAVTGFDGAVGAPNGDGDLVVVGEWGTLTISADGEYTYVRNADAPDGETDTFTYTLTDGDGDPDMATLVITIANGVPTVRVPGANDAGTQVSEAGLPPHDGLPAGTGEIADSDPNNESDDSELTSGTITFTQGDEPATVKIDGAGLGGPVTITGAGQTIVGEYGTLTIDSYDAGTGTITYTYTLTDNVDHDTDLTPTDTFSVTVTDADGQTASDNLVISIANDAPIAVDDTDSVVEGSSTLGNVLTGVGGDGVTAGADIPGADGLPGSPVVGVAKGDTEVNLSGGVGVGGGGIAGDWGTLVLNANGTYTYTATAGLNPPPGTTDKFTYTIIDNDGNLSNAELIITVIDDKQPTLNIPQPGSDGTVVDEAGLPAHNGRPEGTDEAADPAADSDNGEITSGTITFTPGDTPAAVTINGTTVTGTVPQNIVGEYGTLTVTAYDPNGSISYTYTLTNNVDNDTDLTPTDTFAVTVTDVDGDPVSGNLVINILDDGPIAAADTDSVVEGGSTGGNVLTGAGGDGNAAGADTPGADGYASSTVVGVQVGTTAGISNGSGVGGTGVHGAYGTLVLNADGTYTYQADSNTNPAPGATDTFTYTIVDNDGTLSHTTLTIGVIDDKQPVAGSATANVDDEGLAGGIAGIAANGDLDANVGDANAAQPGDTEAIWKGTLGGTDGDGTTTFLFEQSLELDTDDTLGQETLRYDVSADGLTLQAFVAAGDPSGRGGTLLFTVQITNADTGAYTLTLNDNILHTAGGQENNASIVIPYQMIDADNDLSVSPGQLTINFDDDMPTALTPEAASVTNNASGFDTGTLDTGDLTIADNVGADGGIARFASTGFPSLSSGGTPLVYTLSNNDQTLTATAGSGGPVIFTATISGSGYTIDMNGTLDSLQHVDLNPLSSGFLGGNDPWAGFNLTGPGDILLTPTSTSGTLASDGNTVNTSNILLGIGTGQAVDVNEGLRIDFVKNLGGTAQKTDNGGYSDPDNRDHTFDDHYVTNGASVKMTQESGTVKIALEAFDDFNGTGVSDPNYSGTDGNDVVGDGSQEAITGITIKYLGVTYEDPTTHSQIIVPTSTATNYTVNGHVFTVQLAPDGKTVWVTGIEGDNGNSGAGTEVAVFTADGYTSLEVTNISTDSSASFKISSIGAAVLTTNPVQFNLPVQIIDGDGDVSATTNIAVTATSAAPPVALDMNHDGQVGFLSNDAGVTYDYGHGLVSTAWVAPEDGILVRDANGDGTVTDASEFVFGSSNVTDLEALAAQYGSTLDSSDTGFGAFAVWQDANSNGVAEAGEVQSLTALGIASITLTSDGIAFSAANGDVSVAGSGSYIRTDGSMGVLADAAFRLGGAVQDQLRNGTVNGTNAALIGAIAAAGLASAPAAAHAVDCESGNQLSSQSGSLDLDSRSQLTSNEKSNVDHALVGETKEQVEDDTGSRHASRGHSNDNGDHSLNNHGDAHEGQAPTELLAGTDAPEQDAPAQSTFTSGSVAMPSAEMIAAANAENAVDVQPKSTGEVGRVLADALAGGGHGPDIDAVIQAVANHGHGGGHGPAEALASQGHGPVSGWDMASLAGFSGGHPAFTMETMQLHHDAVQPAA